MGRKSGIGIKGRVVFTVYNSVGEIKRFEPNLWQRVLGMGGTPMRITNHNIVTNEGDAMIADLMADSPARIKVSGSNGHIEVGTGYTSESKTATGCTTPVASPENLDSGYPQLKQSWGSASDNVIVYRATFEAGDLDNTGIDEAALISASVIGEADCLAYAQISPAVDVASTDTLQVDWELTFTGA